MRHLNEGDPRIEARHQEFVAHNNERIEVLKSIRSTIEKAAFAIFVPVVYMAFFKDMF